mmetsp:Transcript_52004/g.103495  ORF Transcript_52004/g.103495 Transcript_52004/m.103495 type:complete len:212 (-) Transcript_52004:265-900(-)
MPAATSRQRATKVSVERVSATSRNIRRSTTEPRARTLPKPRVALAVSSPIAPGSVGIVPLMYGRMTRSGATARSCRSRMEVAACPAASSSHSRSLRTGKTKADVESAPAIAATSASIGLWMLMRLASSGRKRSRNSGPPERKAKVSTPIVRESCARPSGRYCVSAANRSRDTSRPSEKRRKRIPKSPSSMSASLFEKMSAPCGPRMAPSTK